MSTSGATARVARSRAGVGGVPVDRVAMLGSSVSRSAPDGDLLRRRLRRAGALQAEDAGGVGGLRAIGVEALAEAHGACERAERPFPPLVALLGGVWLGSPFAPDRHGVADQ